MTATDWAIPGAKAAIYSGRSRTCNVEIVEIERLTATQIVIVRNDRRYRRDNLHQVGDHYASELLPVTDPRVYAVQEKATVDRAFHGAKNATEKALKWPKSRDEAIAMLTEAAAAIAVALDALEGGKP